MALGCKAARVHVHVLSMLCVCASYSYHKSNTSKVKMLAVIVTAFYVIVSTTGILNDDYPRKNRLPGNQERHKFSGNAEVSTNFPTNVCRI